MQLTHDYSSLKIEESEEIAALPQVKKKEIKDALSLFVFMWIFSVCIFSSGNLGSQLVEYKEEMYITSDCGKTWRQVKMNTEKTLMVCECVLQ